MQRKVIVVFGGSFNPPLYSHFSLAEQIVNEYEIVQKVIFVPVNGKYEKQELLSNEHRYKMLAIVCNKNKNFEVSRVELESNRPLYTIETLKEIQQQYPDHEIWFTIGSDNLRTLHTWERATELAKNFKILILERDQDRMEEIIQNNSFLQENKQAFIKVKNNIRSNLSSTFVREKIKRGKSIRYLTPDEVYYYIKENNLFQKEEIEC